MRLVGPWCLVDHDGPDDQTLAPGTLGLMTAGRGIAHVAAARESWMRDASGFGAVRGAGERLAAPPLPPGRLRPGGRAR